MRENNPLVSIIVITYNSAKFVLETLESAKAQSYQNIELIVSDDCSSDNTVEICREWIEENKDRFVHTELITVPENTGISSNFQRGVMTAKGDWIKIIAGDDILFHDCIYSMLTFCQENNYKIAFSKMKNLRNNELIDFPISKEFRYFFSLTVEQKLLFYTINPIFLNPPSEFFSTQIFHKYDLIDTEFKLLEDQPFYVNALQNKIDMGMNFSDTLVGYRTDNQSVTRTINPDFYRNLLHSFNKYRKHNIPNTLEGRIYKKLVELRFFWLIKYYKEGKRINAKIKMYWKKINDFLAVRIISKEIKCSLKP